MDPDSDRALHDDALATEIELLGEVVLAVSGLARHLSPDEVDRLLHLDEPPPGPSDAPNAPDAPGRQREGGEATPEDDVTG